MLTDANRRLRGAVAILEAYVSSIVDANCQPVDAPEYNGNDAKIIACLLNVRAAYLLAIIGCKAPCDCEALAAEYLAAASECIEGIE